MDALQIFLQSACKGKWKVRGKRASGPQHLAHAAGGMASGHAAGAMRHA